MKFALSLLSLCLALLLAGCGGVETGVIDRDEEGLTELQDSEAQFYEQMEAMSNE